MEAKQKILKKQIKKLKEELKFEKQMVKELLIIQKIQLDHFLEVTENIQ